MNLRTRRAAVHLASVDYPIAATNLDELTDALGAGHRRRIQDLRPALPTALGAIIGRALNLDPRQRHQRAADIERELVGC